MPPDRITEWSVFQPFLTDPILLVGSLLPILIVGILLYQRIRLTRRLTRMAARNAETIDQTAARWQESAARTEKMIALLTDIRDHMARIALPAPSGEPPKSEYELRDASTANSDETNTAT